MNKKWISVMVSILLIALLFCGCKEADHIQGSELPDGIYTAEFHTDSAMFHVSEACDDKGTLTVKDGEMTLHISLSSKNVLNLYPGLAADASKKGAELLLPTEDVVTYSDGLTEEVYGFDIPVPILEEEFDLALIGKKEKWYDHKVIVSNPVPLEERNSQSEKQLELTDGSYTIDLTFAGGSGKAKINSPAKVTVSGDTVTALVQWDSPNYDYMLVDGKKYLPVNTQGDSLFEIPILFFDKPMSVTGDTVAMSKPHEIEYTITFHSDTIKSTELIYEGSMELQYAQNFTADYYKGGYTLLTIKDGTKILVVPKDQKVPEGLDADIHVMQQPVQNLYLVASAAMDMFDAIDAVDTIRLSGQKEENWYIDSAKEAMKKGNMIYAGKYNKPDYELIVSENCSMAIENMMISHSPEIIDMLEDFEIPVMIEYSSYESHPLGRVEWVKFFGALVGKEEEAERAFKEQSVLLDKIATAEKTNRTIAFFYITSNGMVQVRQSSDYIPKMIELAGGKYIFENLGDQESSRSTINMQMEEFYDTAKNADYIIYNSSIDGGVNSVRELLDKCAVLKDFKAVQEDNVWCTSNDMYQQSMSIGYMISDIHSMLQGEDEKNMKYLFRLE